MWFFHLGKDAFEAGKAVLGLVKAFGWLRAALMAGILGALVLLGQDLWTFYNGGVSVTGWMLQDFPDAVRTMEDYLAVLGAAFLALSLKSGPIGLMGLAIYEIVQAGIDLKENWSAIQDWWDGLWDDMANAVAKVINPMVKVLHFFGLAMDTEGIATGRVESNARYQVRKIDDFINGTQGKRKAKEDAESAQAIPWLGHGATPQHRFAQAGAYWAKQSAGNVHTESHIGAIHMHFTGAPKPEDAKKLYQAIKREAALEGLMSNASKDENRVGYMNNAPVHT